MWAANVRTLSKFKCVCIGNRARSKSGLGIIPPLNISRKTSVCTGVPMIITVYSERSKKNRVHTEIEYSIY